ncbi:two-component regulator propeller domain-containing protein [Mariniflexile soesokkakense]|uniref:histidine kinase n=1 Tax=Mariniflexile soesokkakense TaxID=1343160 RepID=A0ABV0AGF7_9FLAO
MKVLFKFILLFFGGIIICSSQSQPVFKKINQFAGLSNGRVTSIVKNNNDFVWIGTNNGLNRYDGKDIKIYNKQNSSLSANDISDLLIDSKGTMWIATLGGGLNFYNPTNNTFHSFKNIPKTPNSLLSNHVNALIEDLNGFIWLGTEKGLCMLNKETQKFTSFPYQFDKSKTQSFNITSIFEDKNNNLWIGTFGNGLYLFEKSKERFTKILSNQVYLSDFINVISSLNSDKILIGTNGSGLIMIDLTTNTFSNYFKDNINLKEEIKIVRSINKDKKDNLWVGTDGNGLFEIEYPNGKEPTVHNYTHNSQLESSLSGNTIYKIIDDNDSNIWIGTAWNGINVLDKRQTNELLYGDIIGVNPTPVLSILKTKKHLYLGLDGDGLTDYNQESKKIKYYNEKNKASIGGRYIQKITETEDGNLWLGTFTNGLIKFNDKTENFKQYKLQFENQNSISFNDVRDIIEDKNNNLWIATWGGGLNYFNTKTENFISYREGKGKDNTVNNDNVIALEEDGDNIWIGTYGGGVNLLNTTTRKFAHFIHSESNNASISSNNVFSLLKDSNGYLWIGTSGEGVNRMDLKSKKIERFQLEEKIKYQTITGIIEDDNRNIWFSTKHGIFNYSYKTKTFNSFSNLKGEFHINSVFKDELGFLYFGGIQGVVKFNPNTVQIKQNQPIVKITNFKLFNKELEISKDGILKKAVPYVNDIALEHNQNVVTFEFAALEFPDSQNCEYAIKMENFDNDWREIGKDRTATFTNLSPGDYIFKVKSKETGGDWSANYTAVNLMILKPFWLKWWAFVIYSIILLGLFYLFRKYTIAWERMKSNLEFEKLTHEKDNELYNLKQQFFTNISHEIRTPVTLILSSINRLFDKGSILEKKDANAAHLIKKSSNNLLGLVNELLDIRKLESNQMQLRVTKGEIVSYCKEIFLSFSEIASDRHIKYTFKSEVESLELWYDKNQLEKVIYNVLTNAFKFTKNKGKIELKIEQNKEAVFIFIKDSGIGMSDVFLSKIFNRFYQEKTTETSDKPGFGLGLSISKEIINLHKGDINVESKKDVGSTFEIKLVKGKKHFSNDVIVTEEEFISTAKENKNKRSVKLEKSGKEKPVVLIVEDNIEIQNYLKEILMDNYTIIQAFNGEEGIASALKIFPDLIISDVMMPIMDGIEFTKKLKQNPNTSHIPIIILTARTSPKNKMEGFETGADEYVTKPFDDDLLKTRISNLLANRKRLQNKFRNEKILTPKELAINSIDQMFLEKLYLSLDKNMESNNLSAEIISKEIGMSHSVMYKKIKALTDLSYIEFIREYRLFVAKKLIAEFGYSVSNACYKVGYSDRKYFSKLFKQKFKKNPSDYLKS